MAYKRERLMMACVWFVTQLSGKDPIESLPQMKIYLLTYGPDLTTEPSLAHYSLSLTHLLANAKL